MYLTFNLDLASAHITELKNDRFAGRPDLCADISK